MLYVHGDDISKWPLGTLRWTDGVLISMFRSQMSRHYPVSTGSSAVFSFSAVMSEYMRVPMMCVCVFERERESGLCPLGLSVSLIKDRRLTERECVARLACRPRQQHTTPAVWRERATGRERVWWWGGGCWRKEGLMRGGGGYSYPNSCSVSVFKSKQLRLSHKRCLALFKGQVLNKSQRAKYCFSNGK